MTNSHISPARQGARNGGITGIYLGFLLMLAVLTAGTPLEGLLSTAMALLFPVLVYRIVSRDFKAWGRKASIGALWLDALVTIVCGALIASTVLLIYLRWIDTDFLTRRWTEAIEQLREAPDPEIQLMADNFETAAANGFRITPIMFTMTILWGAMFSGSLLALAVAAVVRLRHGRRRNTTTSY